MAFCANAQNNDYLLKIGDFNQLTVAANITVDYRCVPDSAGLAIFSASPTVAHAITFTNKNNKLKIEVLSDDPIVEPLPVVTVYSLSLLEASNWGDSTLTVATNNPGAKFKANVIGNGNIVANGVWATQVEASVKAGNGHVFLTGKAQSAKFTIMSVGAIEALNLEAINVKCAMVGTGSIDCNASETLSITGMGSGKVFYTGNPTVKNHTVGVKIVKM